MSAPQLVDRDPEAITAALVRQWELLADKPLYPAQVERLFIDVLAYRETSVRERIQDAATQNLLRYARAGMLDELGALLGAKRLPPAPARCTLRFTLAAPLPRDVVIPAGARLLAAGLAFVTMRPAVLSRELLVEVAAEAETTGPLGNGYVAGTITQPLFELPPGVTVQNIDTTRGGLAEEDDERFRARLALAASAPSAGSLDAYRYQVLSVSTELVDVGVVVPRPGRVELFPLTDSGAPDMPLRLAVKRQVTRSDVRPLTDDVEVRAIEPLIVNGAARVLVDRRADPAAVLANASAELTKLARQLRCKAGADLIRSQVVARLHQVAGIARVLDLPAEWDIAVPGSAYVDLRLRPEIAGVHDD